MLLSSTLKNIHAQKIKLGLERSIQPRGGKGESVREILFKGKRVDNGEWVEGWYGCITKGAYLNPIINGHYITTFKKLDNGEIILTGMFEVIPETVGQYTGLKTRTVR